MVSKLEKKHGRTLERSQKKYASGTKSTTVENQLLPQDIANYMGIRINMEAGTVRFFLAANLHEMRRHSSF